MLRGCSTGGPDGPALCWVCFSLLLTATTGSRLTELPVAPGYIIVCLPPASCERHICTEFSPSTVKAIPWYLRPDAPVLWLTAGSICYRCTKVKLRQMVQRRRILMTMFQGLSTKRWHWLTVNVLERKVKRTWQYWRLRWCINTKTGGLY